MSNFCTCCGRNHPHEAPCPPECVTCAAEEGYLNDSQELEIINDGNTTGRL